MIFGGKGSSEKIETNCLEGKPGIVTLIRRQKTDNGVMTLAFSTGPVSFKRVVPRNVLVLLDHDVVEMVMS